MTQTARLYGGSLYDLAAEEQLTEEIMQQMQEIRKIFRKYPKYLHLLKEPSIPKEERKRMIEAAFGTQAERYLVSFLKLLCDKGILSEYAGCCDEFTRRYNTDHGIAEAVVTSAVALSKEQMAALKRKLEKASGKKIVLVQRRDPSILAGLRVELEGKQMDGTIQGRLSGISRKLDEIIV
ncbi:MAG: ATP synthase F1 subunit delta [Eubacteriales bacterium]|nr:ATP synthase F1 subunit delta [Eubacteriales bacterium]